MDSLLKIRVKARLAALDINPFEAARAGPLERNFVNDILIDKKVSVQGKNLTKLAAALRCSIDYLVNADAPEPVDEPPSEGPAPDTPKAQVLRAVEDADPEVLEDLSSAIVVMLRARAPAEQVRVVDKALAVKADEAHASPNKAYKARVDAQVDARIKPGGRQKETPARNRRRDDR